MNFIRNIFVALSALLWMSSCQQVDIQGNYERTSDDVITFCTTNYNGNASRADEDADGDEAFITYDNFNEFYVTSFLGADKIPYFENTCFKYRESDELNTKKIFSSDIPYLWPVTPIEFYGYYPNSDYNENSYTFENEDDSYKLKEFSISPEMEQKVDFLAAKTKKAYSEVAMDVNNKNNSVHLAFEHELCNVTVEAYSNNTVYDYEIIGIRLGNPGMTGDFNFDADPATSDKEEGCTYSAKNGRWENIRPERYEYIFKPGDKVALLPKKGEDQKRADSISIMGNAKSAMVIPIKNDPWSKIYDKAETTRPTTTTEMYISVLIRVSRNNGIDVAYPYPHQSEYPYPKKTETTAEKGKEQEERYNLFNDRLIYFAIDNRPEHKGEVIDRLYLREDMPWLFYTKPKELDPEGNFPYGWYEYGDVELFGWAAIPVPADWEPGKQYNYTLDFSSGLGLHDPDYPDPGQPIYNVTHPTVTWGKRVKWTVKVNNWVQGSYNPDVEIDFE